MGESIFIQFCKYVDESIFTEENRGEKVAFIVDRAFIDDFCKKYSTSEEALMKEVRTNLRRVSKVNHLHVKGILAIQLYAATKREDSEEVSASNYRIRLCQILGWDMNQDLIPWMRENQDSYWNFLYSWCKQNDFLIDQCNPDYGSWRYVRYPIVQAERVFTQKDLKDIAFSFVKHKLQPGEDISEYEFWGILKKRQLPYYVHTNHGRKIVDKPEYIQDAYRQIYNFYLRWNGEYLDIEKNRSDGISEEQYFMYLSEDGYIDVRDKDMRLKEQISWQTLSISRINKYYSFKRDNWVLFRRNDDYERYWEETRFLESRVEEGVVKYEEGIVLVFTKNDFVHRNSVLNPFTGLTPIYSNKTIAVYKIRHSTNWSYLYTEKRFFSLEGGLKIGRMQYLPGGAPILSISKRSQFWIDGKKYSLDLSEGHVDLNFLKVGSHEIKFHGFKKIEFKIVNPEVSTPSWDESYNKWVISSKDKQWTTAKSSNGIIGLDYSIYGTGKKPETDSSVITRWAKFHLMGNIAKDETNVALKLLISTRYE